MTKQFGDEINHHIQLPAEIQEGFWNSSLAKKVSTDTGRKAHVHKLEFPTNSVGIDYVQITKEVFNNETTEQDLFAEALNFVRIEHCALTN